MINNKLIVNKNMLVLALVCLGLLIVTAAFSVTSISNWFGQDEIINVIDNYLNQSQQTARYDLIKLSELAALLSLIQSSEVGVSFFVDIQVGVGQLITSLSSLVIKAIEASLLAISAVEIIKLTVKFSEMITPWIFLTLLVSGTLYGFNHAFIQGNHRYKTVCDSFTKVVVTLFLVFHLFLPYSLYGAAYLSQHLTNETKLENQAALKNLHENMDATHKKEDLKDRAENAIHTFEKIVLDLPQKVEAMTVYYTRHIAMTLFEYILMPIMLFSIAVMTSIWLMRASKS